MLKNKYTWIGVNLLLSLMLSFFLIYGLFTSELPANPTDSDFKAMVIYLALCIPPLIWFFTTMSVWKKVLRSEDDVFDKAFTK